MLTKKHFVQSIAVAAPAVLMLSLALPAQADKTFAQHGKGQIPKNSYGECWQSVGGLPPSPECGGAMDSDGDGVMDSKDRCPGTPKGVKVDASGCPLDSDGDGVADYLDKCPGTPAGAPVDSSGCPLDSDGDGVADYLDKCPGTPRGAKVDSDGCIMSLTLESVNFAHDKATLRPQAMATLDQAAAAIKSQPNITRVTVTGHTDSSGPDAYNQGLSERRAASVVNYLTKMGVSSSKLRAVGKGESMPVASNATREGRAKNRRVELSVDR